MHILIYITVLRHLQLYLIINNFKFLILMFKLISKKIIINHYVSQVGIKYIDYLHLNYSNIILNVRP